MSDRREFRELSSPETLRETIASLSIDAGSERVALGDARGRVLAERVTAAIDVPGFDRAAMDGYAVRAADTFGASEGAPVTLDVTGAVHAGEEPAHEVVAGAAVEISTGAVLPPGADAVVVVEATSETAAGVEVRTAVAPGDNVMPAGADVAAGARALGPGTRLTPREIGLLSALGVGTVPVVGAPRVGVVSTGDELVRPGGDLDAAAGQIYDVNSHTVAAAVAEAGGDPVLYDHVGDDEAAIERALRTAADECDLVLSSGSTSAATTDVVYRIVEEEGELLLHGVAVKPGKPTLVGRFAGAAYVGLPGYPVSALTIFRTFVAPAIREAAGLPAPETATVDATMAGRERFDEGRMRLLPVGLVTDGGGGLLAYGVDKGSGATTTLVDADGVVEVGPDTRYLDAGEPVSVELFSVDGRPPRLLAVGEADPALARLLDGVDRPRWLARGSRGAVRSLRAGLPDVAIVAGPVDPETETVTLGGWTREWGLLVPAGNPRGVAGLADLLDGDLAFVNRDGQSGLRASLDAALADLADGRERGADALASRIRGYGVETPGIESPGRRVAAGDADAGLGLRATAAALDLAFVPLGAEPVRALAAPDRVEKPGVRAFAGELDDLARVLDGLPGYGSLD